jgi:hypothetical protein
MLEKNIESYLREKVKEQGGIAYKWVSPGNSGVPDRIVVLPGNKVVFVELKAPGKKPTALQVNQHKKLTLRGCDVRVIDSKLQVDLLLQELV